MTIHPVLIHTTPTEEAFHCHTYTQYAYRNFFSVDKYTKILWLTYCYPLYEILHPFGVWIKQDLVQGFTEVGSSADHSY